MRSHIRRTGAVSRWGGGIGIWIYDAQTGEEVALIGAHTGLVSSVAYSPNGNTYSQPGIMAATCGYGIQRPTHSEIRSQDTPTRS